MRVTTVSACLIMRFFFNDTATTEIYTLSLHDALPILTFVLPPLLYNAALDSSLIDIRRNMRTVISLSVVLVLVTALLIGDRKSTRLNSSHANISYAVFCLKKKQHFLLASSLPALTSGC